MDEIRTETPREAIEAHRNNLLSTIPRPKFQQISASEMVLSPVNPAETVSRRWVDFYKRQLAEALIDPLRVVKRAEGYEIIDGRHRWIAIQELGLYDYVFLCLVHEGLSEQEAAALHQYFNTIRRTVSEQERHGVAVLHGDPVAVIVEKALKETPHKVGCIRTLHQIVERAHDLDEGETALRWTLSILPECFPTAEDKDIFNSRLVKPFGLFFIRYRDNPNFVPDDMPWRILQERKTAKQLQHMGETFGGNEGSARFLVRVLAQIHNKGRRQTKRLPE